jgi:uncharacterized Zn finger protein
MTRQAGTVSDLIARFQLRRRAASDAFAAGVRLARQGDVSLDTVADLEVAGTVQDAQPFFVRIVVDEEGLVGVCPCDAADGSVCRHQVAVAHALWARHRRFLRGGRE